MDHKIDFDLTMPAQAEDKQAKIKGECKKIADFFEASSIDMFEIQDGLVFHLEFDDAEKFGKFAEFLEARGLLHVDAIQTESDKVH